MFLFSPFVRKNNLTWFSIRFLYDSGKLMFEVATVPTKEFFAFPKKRRGYTAWKSTVDQKSIL